MLAPAEGPHAGCPRLRAPRRAREGVGAQGGNFARSPRVGAAGPGGGGDRGRGRGPALTHRPPPAPGRGSAPAAATAPRPAPAAAPPGGHRRRSPASHDTSSARQRHPVRRHLQRESRSASPLPGAPRVAPATPASPGTRSRPAPPPSRPRGSPAAAATCGGPPARAGGTSAAAAAASAAAARQAAGAGRSAHAHTPAHTPAYTPAHTHGDAARRPYLGAGQRQPQRSPARAARPPARPARSGAERRSGEPCAAGARAAPARRARMAAAGTAPPPLRAVPPGSPPPRDTPSAPAPPRGGPGEVEASPPRVCARFHLKRGFVVRSSDGASLECPVLRHVGRTLDERRGLAALVAVPHLSQFLGVGRCAPGRSHPSAASGERQDAWACRLELFAVRKQHAAISSESVKFTATNH